MENHVPVDETGTLGVMHLKRFWRGRLAMLENRGGPHRLPEENNLDHILLDGLGLGLVAPDRYLFHHRPEFAQFEHWVLDTLKGELPANTVAQVNRAIANILSRPPNDYPLATPIPDPVLTEAEMAFWEENGYILLRGAVSAEDARLAEQAVWEYSGKDPDAPDTWYGGGETFWVPLFRHPALDRNRESTRIHKAFAQIWGTEDLLVSIDRTSLNLPLLDGGADLSGPSDLHWDASIVQPMPFGVQGILYLADTTTEQGAFHCVPGFHHRIREWMDTLPPDTDPRTAARELESVPIAANAGDMIIWRHDLPHGSGRNYADYPRVAQYITLYPPDFGRNPVWK